MTLRTFMTRLIWLCVLPGVVVAAVLAGWHVADSRDDLALRADQQARSAVALVGQYLGARRGALQILASSRHIDDPARWPALEQEARQLVATFGGAVALADRHGRLQFHTGIPHGAELPALPDADAAAIAAAALGIDRTTVFDRMADPVSGADAVVVAAPQTASSTSAHVVLHFVPVELLQQQLDRRAMPGDWPLRLLDRQGRVLAASGLSRDEAAVTGGAGLRRTQPLELVPWGVEVQVPGGASAVALARSAFGMTLAVAGALLAGVLGGRWASRRLSGAIRALGDEAPPGPMAETIDEVAAVRHALDGANRARATAEAERRASEQRFRASLEATSLALHVSKSQLETALESMNDAVAIVDAGGSVLQVNSAFAGFFRFPGRDACPRTMAEYAALIESALPDGTELPPSDWPLARALRGETASAAEVALRRRDTGDRWAGSFSCAPIRDETGAVAGAVMSARDITEIRRVRAELEYSHAELRRLVAAQDSVQEQERRRIARELHDDLQQTLAAILMEVTTTRGLRQAADAGIAEGLSRIDRLATAAIVSTRRIVDDLRPQMLQELGLVPALGVLVRGFGERSGLACRFEVAGPAGEVDTIDDIIATCLYRVAQEALTNVGKHARARRVEVVLARVGPNRLRLSVSDDGRGIARFEHRRPGSFGLLGMRERVHALGGTVQVAPRSGGGTRVEVEIDASAPQPMNGA